MAHTKGESKKGNFRVDLDRWLKLEIHGSRVTSDAGLLPYRELDNALGLTKMTSEVLTDIETDKNERHGLIALLRQSVFG